MPAVNEVSEEQMRAARLLMKQKAIGLAEAVERVLAGEEPADPTQKKPHKYGAVKTIVDDITFASKAEAAQYVSLKQQEQLGLIVHLELQPRFPLLVNGIKIGEYRADFRFRDVATGEVHVQDVKGVKTPIYRWKAKHVKAQYGITIEEVAA